jgi:formamidopyrimidine-DNA glycosylase
MPELAEVAYACSLWKPGINKQIIKVYLNNSSRVFRDCDTELLAQGIVAEILKQSSTHGKQMLFQFSGDRWLGLHLGMTGSLSMGPSSYQPVKHDALVLYQSKASLIFKDPRQFGKIRLHLGKTSPSWWDDLPPSILSKEFKKQTVLKALSKHAKRPVKALLLDQRYFQGMGNWMADEVLWRTGIHPASRCGQIDETAANDLFTKILFVAKGAMKSVGENGGDPPKGWLFHARWKDGGVCPKTGKNLRREKIGGRTSCWCPDSQKFS